jgi:tetratricopeptide (TPR) repeat protein
VGHSDGATQPPGRARAARSPGALRRASRLGLAGALVVAVATSAWQIRTAHLRTQADALRREARIKLIHLEIDDAEELLHKAVALDPDSSLVHADLAVALAERGNYQKAREAADAAAARIEPLSSHDRAWVLGVAAEMRWDLTAAMNAYAIAHTRSDDGGFEATLRLAHVQTLAGRDRDARASLDRIAAAASADDLRIDYERVKAIAASVASNDQVRLLDDIARRSAQDPRIVAVALWKQCSLLGANDEPRSVEACDRALRLFADKRDTLGRARVLSVQATLEAKGLGRYANTALRERLSEATSLADEAEGLARELQSQIDRAGALHNRASVWQQRIPYDRVRATTNASDDHKAAMKIFSDLGDRVSVAMLQNNWGLVQLQAWQNRQARDLFREARDTFRSSGAEDYVGVADANLGKAKLLLGELPGAEANLIEALQIADANRINSYPADALINLGAVYLARGRVHEAAQCLQGVRGTRRPRTSATLATGKRRC